MSTAVAVKAIKKAKKAPKIVKKRTKTFFRFQSDRFDRVKVCLPKIYSFDKSLFFRSQAGGSPVVLITESEESTRVLF
jgi:hypothetical protein